ncbi:hypothetical protein P8452_10387 [Trifolium repens]|nr:hypothetical protein P8452_10387 [Trifolium repens]
MTLVSCDNSKPQPHVQKCYKATVRISDLPFIRFRSPLHFYYLKEESLLLSLIDKKYLLNHNQHLLILIILKLHFLPFLLIKAKYSI